MKHSKISIKWKIYSYLFGFTLLLLAFLWLFQIAYLEVFYTHIKLNELDDATNEVTEAVAADSDYSDLQDTIDSIAEQYNISILVADSDGTDQITSSGNDSYSNTLINSLFQVEIKHYADEAENSANKIFEDDDYSPSGFKIEMDIPGTIEGDSAGSDNSTEITIENNKDETRTSTLRSIIVTNDNGEDKVVILISVLTPVDATVQTLKVQLLYISVIIIVLALVISLMISRRVSKSIIKVNKSALKLAQGDYNVKFTGTDYREIAELSNTLNVAASELAKTESLQRELIANVSHDLRTPLTMIIGYSEVMRDLPGENTPENVQVVIDEAKRLANLVNDLLDISRIQSGVTPFETRTYDLTKSIEEVMERYCKLVQQNGYQVLFEYNEHIFVNADEEKIFQVVYNLVNNAINYIGEDKTVIVRQILKKGRVRIEVIDHGIGIDKENLEHVWQRYYRGDKEHNRAIMGTGLGLAIVENILRLHNAEYGVESEFGHGSTFWFEIKYEK